MARALLLAAMIALMCPSAHSKGPIFDFDCSKDCMDAQGWDPICVDNDKEPGTGTLFPNTCALMCTSNTNENTPYYKYLPFDESICSSAVGCSVLGKAVNKCKALWVAGYSASPSPKLAPDCDCALIPSKMIVGAGPASAPMPAPAPAPAMA
ncbi:hypothetical protein ABPG77_001243 [Micractinium sp. CCAP 211/92]